MKTVNYPIGCDQTEDRIEDLKWTKNPSGMPEMVCYVRGEKAGLRRTELQFSQNVTIRDSTSSVSLVKGINSYSVSFEVIPSVPKYLKLCKQKQQTNCFHLFRRKIKGIEVEVQDEFGNLAHEGHGNEIQPFSVSHTNPPNADITICRSQKIKLGTYKVFVTCLQVGDFDLFLHLPAIRNVLCVPLTVKIPPASYQHSRVTPETLDKINSFRFEAGKEVVFELQVYDIFGNALSHADNGSRVNFHGQLKPKTRKNQQNVGKDQLTDHDEVCRLNDTGSESNLYQIKFVPLVAGKRELDFSIGGERGSGFPVSFEVVPSQIDSLCAEITSRKVLVNKKVILKVTAFDRFKNVVSLNNQLHKLEIFSRNPNEAKVTVLSEAVEDNKNLCADVIFHTAGEYTIMVNLQATVKGINCVTKTLKVNVTLPPISLSHSRVVSSSPMIAKAGEPVVISVELCDVFGNPVSYGDLKTLNQKIPLRAEFCASPSVRNPSEESADFNHPQEIPGEVKPTQHVGVFELSCIPFVAGERTINVTSTNAVEEPQGISNLPVHVSVFPNKQINFSNILHDFDKTPFLSRYTWQKRENDACVIAKTWQRMIVRMLDQYNNAVKEVPRDISIRLLDADNKSPIVNILETKGEEEDDCEMSDCKSCLYRILKPGKYAVSLSIGEGNKTHDTVTCSSNAKTETEPLLTGKFELEVKDATLSLTNSRYEDEPVFENSQTFFTLKLKDVVHGKDCIRDEQSGIKTLVQETLRITVDDQDKNIENLDVKRDVMKFEISNIGDAGERLLRVFVGEKCISELWLNVVGIQELPKDSLRSTTVRNISGDGKHFELWCEGFERSVVTGQDSSHIDNINRVCASPAGNQRRSDAKVLDAKDVKETNGTVQINLSKLGNDKVKARVVLQLVLMSLEGDHFRRQAWEFDKERSKWKQRAQEAFEKEQYDKASFSKQNKEKYGELMSKAHHKASESVFKFYNYERNQSEIDLHELLVADGEKIKKYRSQLRNDHRYKRRDINKLVIEKRENDNEAIRKLKHRLEAAQRNHSPWLEIVVGAGHHSHGQRQRIRPEVEKLLKQQNLEYRVINKGNFLV